MTLAEIMALAGGASGFGALGLVIAYIVLPKAIEAWRDRAHDQAELQKVHAREETARHKLDASGNALAADVIRQHADAVAAREAEHATTRREHAECLDTVRRLQGEVTEERTARKALEGVVAWLLTRVGLADVPPPDAIAATIERIRQSGTPDPAE